MSFYTPDLSLRLLITPYDLWMLLNNIDDINKDRYPFLSYESIYLNDEVQLLPGGLFG